MEEVENSPTTQVPNQIPNSNKKISLMRPVHTENEMISLLLQYGPQQEIESKTEHQDPPEKNHREEQCKPIRKPKAERIGNMA